MQSAVENCHSKSICELHLTELHGLSGLDFRSWSADFIALCFLIMMSSQIDMSISASRVS